jgi:hypothetical protein
MFKLFKEKKFIFFILSVIFFYLNLRVVNNFGLYNDDWFFFFANNLNFKDWFKSMWGMEGIAIQRHIIVPFYAAIHLFPTKVLYVFSIILSFIIFYLIFTLFKKINTNGTDKKLINEIDLSVIILILSWYFFPFNIGGQFWLTGIIHTKLSTIFLLISILLLINKRLFFSLLFLGFCFNSYEIYFFSYLPLVSIFFYKKLIGKKLFRHYVFLSILIQIFFLFLKKRSSHNLDFIKIIELLYDNSYRFLWSIYQPIPENFNLIFKFSLLFLILVIICITFYNFYISNSQSKKFKIVSFILIIIALGCNSLVHVVGTYGYWGKGIFSRTMFAPSLFLLFLLIIFISNISKRLNLFLSILIFFITIYFFNLEIRNWEKSKKYQNNILNNYLTNKKEFSNKSKNFIFFFGPCYYNGVEIFNATWDLSNAINYNDSNFHKNGSTIIPIQNWSLKRINSKIFSVHGFEFKLDNNTTFYFWDYFDNKIIRINSSSAETLITTVGTIRNNRTCYLSGNENLRMDNARKKFNFLKLIL